MIGRDGLVPEHKLRNWEAGHCGGKRKFHKMIRDMENDTYSLEKVANTDCRGEQ